MKGYAMGIFAGLMLLSGCVFLDGPDAHDEPPGRGRRGEPPPEAENGSDRFKEIIPLVSGT